jgi:hypothetical protein
MPTFHLEVRRGKIVFEGENLKGECVGKDKYWPKKFLLHL